MPVTVMGPDDRPVAADWLVLEEPGGTSSDLGGSSWSDGGAGAWRAVGVSLCDQHGEPLPLGNAELSALASADWSGVAPLPSPATVILSTRSITWHCRLVD